MIDLLIILEKARFQQRKFVKIHDLGLYATLHVRNLVQKTLLVGKVVAELVPLQLSRLLRAIGLRGVKKQVERSNRLNGNFLGLVRR